jgi:hypothetical protein
MDGLNFIYIISSLSDLVRAQKKLSPVFITNPFTKEQTAFLKTGFRSEEKPSLTYIESGLYKGLYQIKIGLFSSNIESLKEEMKEYSWNMIGETPGYESSPIFLCSRNVNFKSILKGLEMNKNLDKSSKIEDNKSKENL